MSRIRDEDIRGGVGRASLHHFPHGAQGRPPSPRGICCGQGWSSPSFVWPPDCNLYRWYSCSGERHRNNPALHWTQILLAQVAFQLGLALIASFFVVRALEHNRMAGSTPANDSVHEGTAPDAASAQRALVRMFWTGIALVVLGLILQESLAAWQYDLSGTVAQSGRPTRQI